MPTIPHRAAGWRMEPPVSVPSDPAQRDAATAAADPPDEPPGTWSSDQGLRTGPRELFSLDEPIANSSMFSLPSMMAPAAASRCDGVDSNGGTKPRRILEAQVVSIPFVTKMSLRASGTPARGPTDSPAAMARSISSARFRAASPATSR